MRQTEAQSDIPASAKEADHETDLAVCTATRILAALGLSQTTEELVNDGKNAETSPPRAWATTEKATVRSSK